MNKQIILALFGLFVLTAAEVDADNELQALAVEGRGIRDTMGDIWEFFFGTGDDDYDYNYDFNPNEVSSYTWYDPQSTRRDALVSEGEEDYSWGEVALGAALAIVPIGLLIAAFPTGLFTIAVKKRSFDDNNILERIDAAQLPLLRSMQGGDFLSLFRQQCQRKLFCELSQLGKREDGSVMQKSFYYVSSLMPENLSKKLRLQRLFDAARDNTCEIFSCQSISSNESLSNHLEAPTVSKDHE